MQETAASGEPDAAGASNFHLLDDPFEWESFGKPADGQNQHAQADWDPRQVTLWESHFALSGMYCATCALTIEDALKAVPGVVSAEVSASARRARVKWLPEKVVPSRLLQAVKDAGYEAMPAKDAASRALNQSQNRKALWRWLLATFCMMQIMMYAWPAYEAQPGDLSMEMERLLRWASWVICIPMLIFACGPFFTGAWRDIRHRRVSMDLPVALGMLLTFVVSTVGTFDPEGIFGREVFFDSLSMFVCFLLTGRWLEIRLRDRTAGALDAVLNRLPDSVEKLQEDGSCQRVALRHIAVGDLVRVLPGEAFPVDGTIERGHTQADEALLTGESRPVARGEGDAVTAGSYNLVAAVDVRVARVGRQTRFSQIVDLMESASVQKPRLALLADKVAGPFLLTVIVMAVGTAMYWWPSDPGHALMVAASVLIVTCPCALSLATPVAMLTAAGTLARQGVLVRNLQGLENLADIDTLIFDKTGTLTCEGVHVIRMQVRDEREAANWQALACAIGEHSRHPVSQAVSAFGNHAQKLWKVMAAEEISGQGVRAQVEIQENSEQFESVWIRLGAHGFAAGEAWGITGQSVYLAQEDSSGVLQPLAAFELNEVLRPEAVRTVEALQKAGIVVQLMSGDRVRAVERVASAAGIGMAEAEFSPEQKLAAMQVAQGQGRQVCMVGDGLNDGPVLAGADVSFAFGRSVPLAQARSDFVVLSNDLGLVLQSVLLARRTLRIVRQNLAWSAAYNAISVPFALMGMMPAWSAGLGMAMSSLLVVVNASRLAGKLPSSCTDSTSLQCASRASERVLQAV